MKQRRNIFKKINKKIPKEINHLIKDLYNDIEIFFVNLSIYKDDKIYIEMYMMVYALNGRYYTTECISNKLYVDIKFVKRFINNTEKFIFRYINYKNTYSILIKYI